MHKNEKIFWLLLSVVLGALLGTAMGVLAALWMAGRLLKWIGL